jgi:hypothetical protein
MPLGLKARRQRRMHEQMAERGHRGPFGRRKKLKERATMASDALERGTALAGSVAETVKETVAEQAASLGKAAMHASEAARPKRRRRGRTPMMILGVLALVGVAASVYIWWQRRREDEEYARLISEPDRPDSGGSDPGWPPSASSEGHDDERSSDAVSSSAPPASTSSTEREEQPAREHAYVPGAPSMSSAESRPSGAVTPLAHSIVKPAPQAASQPVDSARTSLERDESTAVSEAPRTPHHSSAGASVFVSTASLPASAAWRPASSHPSLPSTVTGPWSA